MKFWVLVFESGNQNEKKRMRQQEHTFYLGLELDYFLKSFMKYFCRAIIYSCSRPYLFILLNFRRTNLSILFLRIILFSLYNTFLHLFYKNQQKGVYLNAAKYIWRTNQILKKLEDCLDKTAYILSFSIFAHS